MSTISTPITPSFPVTPSHPLTASTNGAAGSSAPTARDRARSSSVNEGGGIWSEILGKAGRQERKLPKKHVLILGEPNRGKTTLLQHLIKTTPTYLRSEQIRAHGAHQRRAWTSGSAASSGEGAPASSSFAPFVYPALVGGEVRSSAEIGRVQGQARGKGTGKERIGRKGGGDIDALDGRAIARAGLSRLMGDHEADEPDSREPVMMDHIFPLTSSNPTSSPSQRPTGPTTTTSDALAADPKIMYDLEPSIGLAFEWVDVNGDLESDPLSSHHEEGGGRSNAAVNSMGSGVVGEVGDIPMMGIWVPGGSGAGRSDSERPSDGSGTSATGTGGEGSAKKWDGGALDLVKASLKGEDLAHTIALIVLDWSKPHTMIPELLRWLIWLEMWFDEESKLGSGNKDAGQAGGAEGTRKGARGKDRLLMRERLQSYIQHYKEPKPPVNVNTDGPGNITYTTGTLASGMSSYGGVENLLPLGPGVLTRNQSGIPIVIVCTRSDLIDSVGDRLISRGKVSGKGLSGGGATRDGDGRTNPTHWSWDERVDWAQQVLRVIALQYGASTFFVSTAQPRNFPLLRHHLLHRLYTVPPPLTPGTTLDSHSVSLSNRFAFPYRANVLDRDALLLPAGWDSSGKIKALNETFDAKEMEAMCAERLEQLEDEASGRVAREKSDGIINGEEEDDNIELWWEDVMPDPDGANTVTAPPPVRTVAPSEQSFLSRQLDVHVRDPMRDPRKAFRAGVTGVSESGIGTSSVRRAMTTSGATGPAVVGPMGGTIIGGHVDMVLNGMAGSGVGTKRVVADQEQMRTPNAKRDTAAPTSRSPADGSLANGANSNDVLNNFFQGLIAGRKTPAGTPKAA